jgi:hypothetical protein
MNDADAFNMYHRGRPQRPRTNTSWDPAADTETFASGAAGGRPAGPANDARHTAETRKLFKPLLQNRLTPTQNDPRGQRSQPADRHLPRSAPRPPKADRTQRSGQRPHGLASEKKSALQSSASRKRRTASSSSGAELPYFARLVRRGARGELIRQGWFLDVRRNNADAFVLGTFCAAVFLILLMEVGLTPGSWTGVFVAVLLRYPVWVGLGYVYLAVGTKLAHQFLVWGICLGGALIAAWSAFSTVNAIRLAHSVNAVLGVQVLPEGQMIFLLVLHLTMAALFAYSGFMFYSALQRRR